VANYTQKKKGGWKKKFLFLSAFFMLSLLCIIFSCLVLNEIRKPFVKDNFLWFSALLGGIYIASFLFFALCCVKEKEKIIKVGIGIYILLATCLILLFILQITGFFAVFNDPERLQAYLEGAGAWMPIAYIALQFLQVVILPVPGIVSTAVGVAIFGAFWTAIYSVLGIVLGSFVAFYIGRRWGSKAVGWLVGEETLAKWRRKLKGKDNLFLSLMFILPLFPDDILCFVAGLSTMSNQYFAIMIICTRILSIYATCYSVDFIPFNTWWGITIWIAFFAIVVVGFILFYKYADKLQNWIKKKRKMKVDSKK
jgi:uncharacterized membrane protein YdjX (TVP38/TMEM64 family)